ncbi:hypothetical protein MSWAN_0529 [Methanobacterium paludis]|uniref:Uncharacterized protein n=1 Tax=Methanobacterium paludis (strain DSM 25820 / JCM 18151 / SWAN1) TaxID=868131 RepID=F6D532_METPW|nr:hypothetical protein MSWAN_0529 [Methanobacterium paludis]
MNRNPKLNVTYLIRFFYKIINLISPYLSFIFVIIFVTPWINSNFALHNSDQILSLVEVFVLSSATLSLLIFTYIIAMSDLHEKVKTSMVIAGESFLVATVQFIVGLGLFLVVNLLINHFMDIVNVNLSFSVTGLISLLLSAIQFIGIYEVASALSKFLKGIIEVYKTFRVIKRPQLYALLKEYDILP